MIANHVGVDMSLLSVPLPVNQEALAQRKKESEREEAIGTCELPSGVVDAIICLVVEKFQGQAMTNIAIRRKIKQCIYNSRRGVVTLS